MAVAVLARATLTISDQPYSGGSTLRYLGNVHFYCTYQLTDDQISPDQVGEDALKVKAMESLETQAVKQFPTATHAYLFSVKKDEEVDACLPSHQSRVNVFAALYTSEPA